MAPSTELRKWFGHEPARWTQFQARYRKEPGKKKDTLKLLRQKGKTRTVTLVYGARGSQPAGFASRCVSSLSRTSSGER